MSCSPSGHPSPVPAGRLSSPADPDAAPLPMTPGRAGRELVHALAGVPVAVVGLLHLLVMLLSASWSTALVGLPMLAAGVRGSRALGALNLGLARRLLGVRTPAPAPFRPRPGLLGWCASALGDNEGWRATAYLLVKPLTALLALGTAAGFWGGGLLLLTFQDLGPLSVEHPHVLLRLVAGLVLLALAPWALRAALLPEQLLARTLLGPTKTSARIDHLEAPGPVWPRTPR
ncbi:sensor domain-containing protein [Streptosporangium amethystogenes]|uniref:sensor domain-containing protein n=1 Tax=Streptosporangium amethystogenes TaxID=2002 RepID=UPI0012FA24AB|nr:sensor domain-containing protein [Streptosporangium amethystogenes]